MKHAILILSSYGIDYLVANIKQYSKYQDIFDIFVHIDGQTLLDFNEMRKEQDTNFLEYLSEVAGVENIKYVGHEYQSKRYSFDLIFSEIHLFRRAYEYGKYQSYHLTSESCFFYRDIDIFLDFYKRNPDINLIGLKEIENTNIFDEKININSVRMGPQWFSLSYNTLKRCIESGLFEKLFEEANKGLINYPGSVGALDEIVPQTYIANFILTDIDKENWFHSRFIVWGDVGLPRYKFGSPNTLIMEMIENGVELNEWELNNSFWCRKIDYKKKESMEFLEYIKKNYGNKKIDK